jgi:hypothetical protein
MGTAASAHRFEVVLGTLHNIHRAVCLVYGTRIREGDYIKISAMSASHGRLEHTTYTFRVGKLRDEPPESLESPSEYVVLGPIVAGATLKYFQLCPQ